MCIKKLFLLCFIIFSPNFADQGKFILLMGPSGAGKSTLIRLLKELDDRFVYVTPLTTRTLRDGESDKIHIELEEMNTLEKDGQLLTINKIYDIYYATPKGIIDDALAQGKFPILDWPIEKWEIMKKNYGENLYTIYIQPDDLDELQRRLLSDNRDKDGKRYTAGVLEITDFLAGIYDDILDLKLTNKKNQEKETAQIIYATFLASLGN